MHGQRPPPTLAQQRSRERECHTSRVSRHQTQSTTMAYRIGHALVTAAQEVDGSCRLHSLVPETLTDGDGTIVTISASPQHIESVLARLRTRWPLVTSSTSTCALTGACLVATFVPSRDELSRLATQDDFRARRVLSRLLSLVAAAGALVFVSTVISTLAHSD